MEDIGAKIGEILSSPEQMQKLQSLASMLGLGGGDQPPPPPPPQSGQGGGDGLPDLSELLHSGGEGLFGSINPATIASLAGLISKAGKMEKEDMGVALLRALKPLLSEERSRRVDDAARILVLVRMLPLLGEAGILPMGTLGR